MGRAGWRSFVRGSTTRLKTVAESKLAVKDDHCIPQPHVYKLLTDCILICLCGALKTVYVSISGKLQQWLLIFFFFCLMFPPTACQVKPLHQHLTRTAPDVFIWTDYKLNVIFKKWISGDLYFILNKCQSQLSSVKFAFRVAYHLFHYPSYANHFKCQKHYFRCLSLLADLF